MLLSEVRKVCSESCNENVCNFGIRVPQIKAQLTVALHKFKYFPNLFSDLCDFQKFVRLAAN